ncbi:MAG: hypothetical protein JSS75_00345 [Bacteroidetes bacterium]|nr:hypothetical protein [Bacteroidota bacterium]
MRIFAKTNIIMNFLFRETYWAGILILAGILMILKNVFKLDIPVMGVIIPVIIISWGVSLLIGSKGSPADDDNTVLFNHTQTTVNGGSKHSVVFGKTEYDLRNAKPGTRVDVDAVFASATLTVNPNTPMKIKISSAFGSGRLPDGNLVTFGERRYTSPGYREGEPFVDLRCDVVFGDLKIYPDTSSTTTF